jgi:hypothetical protein
MEVARGPAVCGRDLHLVWMGLRLDTDQLNGMAFLRTYLEPDYWPTFWKLFAKARHPDAGNIVPPPFNLGSAPKTLNNPRL